MQAPTNPDLESPNLRLSSSETLRQLALPQTPPHPDLPGSEPWLWFSLLILRQLRYAESNASTLRALWSMDPNCGTDEQLLFDDAVYG